MFVALEGIDGSGTTTQATLLAQRLQQEGFAHVLHTAEPTSSKSGQLLREKLAEPEADPLEMQLLFCANRAEHVATEIGPTLLKSGGIVICDRYHHSTLAYAAATCPHALPALQSLADLFPKPDLTIYLRISPAAALARIALRGQQAECFEQEETLRRVAAAYDQHLPPSSAVLVLDAEWPVDRLHGEVWEAVIARLR